MNDFIGKHTVMMGGEGTLTHLRPPDRARAISGLINEEAFASERLGRLTDKVAAALLDANLLSIRLPQPDGGLGGTGVELFEATEEIAREDGSAGWNMAICNAVSTFIYKGAAAKTRHEIFGNGPVACWATLPPQDIMEIMAGSRHTTLRGAFAADPLQEPRATPNWKHLKKSLVADELRRLAE
jgi:hypothetical protein